MYIGTPQGVTASNTRNSCVTAPRTLLLVSTVTLPDSSLGRAATWEQKSGMGRFIVARDPRIAFMLAKSVTMDDSNPLGIMPAEGARLVQRGANRPWVGEEGAIACVNGRGIGEKEVTFCADC